MATTMTITAAESPMINDDQNERPPLLPLATLIGREIRAEKSDIPIVKYAHSNYVKRGEDLILAKTDCIRVEGDPSTSFSVFGIFDGHNGASAAIYSKEYLLDHVMSAVPLGLTREEWLETLPRALVAGFIKCDIDFQNKIGEISGTTATFVVVDKWTVTAASVGDSRCILEVPGGEVTWLTVDHRLEDNEEEVNRVRASGGEVGRLNVCGNQGIGPLRCWPGGLCLSRSIGDMDVGEYIVPVPHVKQVKLPSSGGRLIIASDGIWDAINCEVAAKACHGLPTELAAKLVVKEALRRCGLKDDTTCLVVDIVPSDHNLKSVAPPPPPPKKTAKEFLASFFRKLSHHDEGKNENKSPIEPVEQLFEEGSASLEIRLPRASSDPFRCAICQVQQTPNEDSLKDDDEEKSENDDENNGSNEMEKNENDESSNGSSQMEGPFLCTDCRKKKDMMEGKIKIRRKRPSKYK